MLLLLLVVFVVVPVVELYVVVQVAHVIHVLPTIGLLLLVSFLGAWLVKREGLRTWTAFREAIAAGRVPARETADGALVIVGGALMLTPGFVTDIVGALFVLPPTRALVRRLFTAVVARRFAVVGWAGNAASAAARARGQREPGEPGAQGGPRRVRAERVDERMPDRRPANEPPPE